MVLVSLAGISIFKSLFLEKLTGRDLTCLFDKRHTDDFIPDTCRWAFRPGDPGPLSKTARTQPLCRSTIREKGPRRWHEDYNGSNYSDVNDHLGRREPRSVIFLPVGYLVGLFSGRVAGPPSTDFGQHSSNCRSGR